MYYKDLCMKGEIFILQFFLLLQFSIRKSNYLKWLEIQKTLLEIYPLRVLLSLRYNCILSISRDTNFLGRRYSTPTAIRYWLFQDKILHRKNILFFYLNFIAILLVLEKLDVYHLQHRPFLLFKYFQQIVIKEI